MEVQSTATVNVFVREARVSMLLDDSLYNVPTEPQQSFLRITRTPGHNWQLNCEANTGTFTRTVQISSLAVVIFTPAPVSCKWGSHSE